MLRNPMPMIAVDISFRIKQSSYCRWVFEKTMSVAIFSALVIASRGSSRGYSQEGKAKGQGAGGGGANVPSMDGWTVKRR